MSSSVAGFSLVRVLLRHPTRSLANPEANALRDQIYLAVHEGTVRVLIGA